MNYQQAFFENRVIELTKEGCSPENIAVVLDDKVEEIERIVTSYMKKTIEGPSKEKGKEARNKEIRQEYADGKTAKYLSNKHGLHVSSIYIICKGIKKKPTPPHSSKQKPSPDVPVPPVKNEHCLHQFEPRYTERRVLSGLVQLYVGDICVQCGKTVQLLKIDW